MSANSKIEWTDHTFNPWVGCTKISPGCDHCYAESWAKRSGMVRWGPDAPRRLTSEANWNQVAKWDRAARLANTRVKVFCASLADVFDNEAKTEWRMRLASLIYDTTNIDWLLLTKRIGNVAPMCSGDSVLFDVIATKVWLGITVVNQEEADRDIPKLLAIPAHKRFLSIEPMLGPVDLERPRPGPDLGQEGNKICQPWLIQSGIDWIIAGGESGPGARPAQPDWFRSLRDQCAAAGVPFFFKQWGEWIESSPLPGGDLGGDLRRGNVQHMHAPGNPEGYYRRGDAYVRRVGKKTAGRILDGRTHDEFPK